MSDGSAKWMGLLPKEETQALEFVQKYPHYDGRGVVVGIFDTGVDPKAVGLNYKTTTGLPKVIDIIDCSGSGDVVMSAEKALNADGTLTGIGNRNIIINPNWKNPTGLYRVGLKRAYDLYPKSLKSRVQEERRKRNDAKFRVIEAKLVKELNELSSKKPAVEEAVLEDMKTKLAQFKTYEKEYDDCGPLYDCVVFHDGTIYQAVVDTSETGNMSNLECMTDYRVHLQCGQFTDIDALTYCVNIYDEGQVLSICTDAGAHGSHVAGIVAANHPDQPELNGIAPGAQIISFKIGDTRLGSMETGVSLIRGCIEAIKRKVDIVNMSYGEATATEDKGAFIQLAEQMVYKHGIIFVASAGNNGPALSTNGCPGNSSCAIGVGAYATESLMDVAYSLSDKTLSSTNYTWSSMSPCPDGHFGTSIMAPGGAVTSVPNWTVSRNMLMNGTSMSSPNACGCITLLLSAAKQENIKISPARITNYIKNSAKFIDHVDILGQGAGLMQVLNAFKLMSFVESSLPSETANDWLDIPYSVKVNSERFSRGIYLRQLNEVNVCSTFGITVDPIFHDGIPVDEKIKFEVRVRLECSAPYVQCPENIYLNSQGKTFNVVIDPRTLGVGVHVTKLKGYDERFKIGPIFEFPITIIKPEAMGEHTTSFAIDTVVLDEAQRYRRFIVPPRGCQFIDVVIRDARKNTPAADDTNDSARNIVFHSLQIYKGVPYRDHEKEDAIRLYPGSSHVVSFAVDDARTLELCFARSWNTIGYTAFNATVYFRGVVPVPSSVTIHGGSKLSEPIRVSAVLHKADLSPCGKLDKWTSVIKPIAVGKISPLGERDVLPDGKILYSLMLEYEIDLSDSFDVVCRFPALQGVLYESYFHAQFYMIYDAKKLLMGVGDAWPSYLKLNKGKYTVRLLVRHSSVPALEPLNDLPLCLERKLKSSIPLSFYRSQCDTVTGNDKIKTVALAMDSSCGVYIKEPTLDQLPKNCSTGDVFTGSMTYLKQNTGELGAGTRPGGYAVKYAYVDTKVKETKAEAAESATVSTLEDAIREAKISYLKSQIDKSDTFLPLYNTLITDYSDDIFIKQLYLSHVLRCKSSSSGGDNAHLSLIIDAANNIISSVDENEIAIVLGTNADKESASSMKTVKEVEKKKAVLLEALNAKGKTLLEIRQSAITSTDARNDASKEFEETFKKIIKWDSITNDAYWQVQIGRLKDKELFGSALKRINELLNLVDGGAVKGKDGISRSNLMNERNAILGKLGWTEVMEGLMKWQRFISKDYYEAF